MMVDQFLLLDGSRVERGSDDSHLDLASRRSITKPSDLKLFRIEAAPFQFTTGSSVCSIDCEVFQTSPAPFPRLFFGKSITAFVPHY